MFPHCLMGPSYASEAVEPFDLVESVLDLLFNMVRPVERDVEQTALSKVVLDE